jgi:hypothetical protein
MNPLTTNLAIHLSAIVIVLSLITMVIGFPFLAVYAANRIKRSRLRQERDNMQKIIDEKLRMSDGLTADWYERTYN